MEDLGNEYKISQKNLMESDHNERLSLGEWILRLCIGFIRIRIGSCEDVNNLSGSVTDGKFIDDLRDHQLINEYSQVTSCFQ